MEKSLSIHWSGMGKPVVKSYHLDLAIIANPKCRGEQLEMWQYCEDVFKSIINMAVRGDASQEKDS